MDHYNPNVLPRMGDVAATALEEALGKSIASLLLPKPLTANQEASRFTGICRSFERVTDGARTRDLRGHNPLKPVAGRCLVLQKPPI